MPPQATTISNHDELHDTWVRSSRSAQFWLVVLLLLSGTIAGGTLFAKYKLESLRGRILETAETRTGTDIKVSSISAFGLRGLRAEGLELSRQLNDGSQVDLKVPLLYVYVDLTELLYGDVAIDRVQVERATVHIRRAAPSAPASGVPALDRMPLTLPPISFRVMGSGCSIVVDNVVGASSLSFSEIAFDVAKLPDSNALSGSIEGIYGDDSEKRIKATARYVSLDDFDARADLSNIAASDVNVFLPASKQFVLEGSVAPSVRIEGKADGTVALSVETPVTGLLVRNQPEFLKPMTGSIDARGQYDPRQRLLTVGMTQARTETLSGAVNGTIQFTDASPAFDLTLSSAQLPLLDILNFAMQDRVDQYGELEYSVSPDAQVAVHLTGTAESPAFRVSASMSGADATFKPKDKRFPEGAVKLGRVDAAWDSATKQAAGSVSIAGGKVEKPDMGLEATNITAAISLAGKRIEVASLNATAKDQSIVASGWYDIDTKSGEANVAGVLAGIGETKLAQSIRNAEISGSATVKAHAKYTNGVLAFDGDVDASQTQIGYRWYFLKSPGIGASAHITGSFTPKKTAKFEVDGVVAGSQLKATTNLAYSGKKWQLRTAHAEVPKLDVVSVGKCLPLPYTITGGTGTNGSYEWTRIDGKADQEWSATLSLAVDEISVRAEGAAAAIVCHDVTLTGDMLEGAKPVTNLKLHAKRATTPSLRGDKWFVPLERDWKKYPVTDRYYSYELAADSLDVPPWSGTDFRGHAYQSMTENGLDKYSAKVGEGTIEGSYVSNRADNSYKTSAKWTNVPAKYFMEHLRQPQMFSGNMNGEVTYTMDRDDQGSIAGTGHFDMGEGQFSADYLISLFERQLAGDVSALPPSLKFSKLQASVEFARDVVRTPDIHLESDAMELNASGEFVLDGDMDYTIKVAVSPDAAERIPLLRDNFNVAGHRLAQEDIDLAFNLSGPTLKPVSTVSETPPVRVTLVSGALETAREAFQVIDAPRKILFDLLKIGGGIVGAKKQPQNGNKN
ncbi:MAG: hypothetical protein IT367_02415 [Candidatus Hydrogenedentes bacterium]|nr:hypothetical protein [Candidatus Hydrogenedentota bacterium]